MDRRDTGDEKRRQCRQQVARAEARGDEETHGHDTREQSDERGRERGISGRADAGAQHAAPLLLVENGDPHGDGTRSPFICVYVCMCVCTCVVISL